MPGHKQYTVNTYRGHGGQGPHCSCFNLMLTPVGLMGPTASVQMQEIRNIPDLAKNQILVILYIASHQLSCHSATKPLNTYNKHVPYICTGEGDIHNHMSLKQINKTQMNFKQRTSPFTIFLVYITNCNNNKQMCLHPEIHRNMYNMIQITTSVAPLQVKKINIFPVHNKHITRRTFCIN